MKQAIRIIGGKYRGKKITFPATSDLRPTPNRVRETLFNWLMHDLRDANCLDTFAGSGVLGFEAYSRSAKSVTFVEKDSNVIKYLSRYAKDLDPHEQDLQIIYMDSLTYLKQTHSSFDLIFLDRLLFHILSAPSRQE